jgi:hypothetical protein
MYVYIYCTQLTSSTLGLLAWFRHDPGFRLSRLWFLVNYFSDSDRDHVVILYVVHQLPFIKITTDLKIQEWLLIIIHGVLILFEEIPFYIQLTFFYHVANENISVWKKKTKHIHTFPLCICFGRAAAATWRSLFLRLLGLVHSRICGQTLLACSRSAVAWTSILGLPGWDSNPGLAAVRLANCCQPRPTRLSSR